MTTLTTYDLLEAPPAVDPFSHLPVPRGFWLTLEGIDCEQTFRDLSANQQVAECWRRYQPARKRSR
jgi:hypothetical protein